ncbi:hypothetical protein QYE76_055728 [Lolium multiflorum]|uniref:Retrotransposon gag domain-containing protein n=1 Tax=Lolium multiflorum TaxID=4521 RepID=A0AAD8WM61_LOLMU|nr:hypothetical protein QYE76_055728 [Lolium multiflorum]
MNANSAVRRPPPPARNNAAGRRRWWSASNRTLENVLAHIEDGNPPVLGMPPPVAPTVLRRHGSSWMSRRMAPSSSSGSRSASRSGGSTPATVKQEWASPSIVKKEPASPPSSSATTLPLRKASGRGSRRRKRPPQTSSPRRRRSARRRPRWRRRCQVAEGPGARRQQPPRTPHRWSSGLERARASKRLPDLAAARQLAARAATPSAARNAAPREVVKLEESGDDDIYLPSRHAPATLAGHEPLYEEETSIARGGEEQLDVKMDVKLDKELDMKISHGRAREREACAREKKSPGRSGPVDRPYAGPPVRPVDRPPTGRQPEEADNKIVNQENKNSADIITWREYEALRNEMRREFRTKDDELKDMRLAIENLTAQQQQQQDDDEDPELEDDAHNARGAPRGHRPRGWVPLGRNGPGQDEEDGLGKPKFSISKFEGGADVEEYLTWELKIEKLWSLHPHYSEDRKIKLASSEFDGYALRWWDSLVRNLDEDGAQPIRTWRAMKGNDFSFCAYKLHEYI